MMLHFKKEFKKDILLGRKKATIRMGERRVKPGQIIILASGKKPFAKARVTKVRKVRLKDIKKQEILKEGYKSYEEFFKELKKIYPKITTNSHVTYIEWTLLRK